MSPKAGKPGFSVVELLIVVSIIALLASIVMPSLAAAKRMARSANCIGNLNALGRAMAMYHSDNKDSFWPCTLPNHPQPGVNTYFWGTNTDPVDPRPSAFLEYCDHDLNYLWCPSLGWGTYVPQGGVSEPTTTYGYNSWCLDPASYRWDFSLPQKRTVQLKGPAAMFVFADSGMAWAPGGVSIFQNSTHLEPVTGPKVAQPTTHFRHRGKTNALCADGHAAPYGLEGGTMGDPAHKLGFVGTSNVPHYDLQDY